MNSRQRQSGRSIGAAMRESLGIDTIEVLS